MAALDDGHQHPFEVAEEALPAPVLVLQTALLLVGRVHVGKRPSEQGWGHQRRHDGHHEDDGVHRRGEDAQAEADGGHDDLHGAAGVHARTEGERLPVAELGGPGSEVGPDELAGDGDGQHEEAHGEGARLGQLAEVDSQPRGGEEDRGEHPQRHLLEDVAQALVEALDLADEDPDDEGPEHGFEVEQLGHRCERQGQGDQRGDHDHVATDVVVQRAQQPADGPAANGGGDEQHAQHGQDRPPGSRRLDGPAAGHAGHDREQDPPDRVVDHARRERDLADVAPDDVHLHQDLGDHGDGGDAHRRADEQGEDQPLVGRAEEINGDGEAQADSGGERDGDATEGDGRSPFALAGD